MSYKTLKKLTFIVAFICLLSGIAGGFYGRYIFQPPLISDRFEIPGESTFTEETTNEVEQYVSGEVEISFLELGNKYNGDCVFIKAGDNDILIDAGSNEYSIPTITKFIDRYVTDGKLEYVIVTHAHKDHYAGFATNEYMDSIFDIYECEVIIDFAQTQPGKKTQTQYLNYIRERDDEIARGAVHYTAKDCIDMGKDRFSLGEGIELQILDNKFYHEVAPGGENNHSVCCMINQGDRHFLFTGDLEREGEESLIQRNKLPCVDVYKAGHHGSKTSSNPIFMSVIRPKIICVCCSCGSSQYTGKNENQFPTQAFVDSVARYTDKVYVTTYCKDYSTNQYSSMNGNITVVSDSGELRVNCSASDQVLKDSDWFRENRICPSYWNIQNKKCA